MRILITGSSGMLGIDLASVLAKSHEVIGLDIKGSPLSKGDLASFEELDITAADGVRSVIDKTAAEVVIHAAAWTDVDGCELDPSRAEKVNTLGAVNVAKAAAAHDIPVIFISTDFVFNGTARTPYRELEKADPINVYGRTKYEAEKYILNNVYRHAIVRTSWLFGPHGKNFVDTVVAKAESGEELKVVDDQIGSPTYTVDLAMAMKELIQLGAMNGREIFHVSNAGRCSWRDVASFAVSTSGFSKVKVKAISSQELARPAKRPAYSVLDNEKFNKLTGMRMRSWKDALLEHLKRKGKA